MYSAWLESRFIIVKKAGCVAIAARVVLTDYRASGFGARQALYDTSSQVCHPGNTPNVWGFD
jgi:hypothetical protein